jgi:outer membrane lipoprotein-sorting protein
MRIVLSIIFFSLFSLHADGQHFTKTADNDPKAKAVLEKMRKKYETYKSLEAEFTLTIEFPEQPIKNQKGKLVQQNEKYRLTLPDQTLVCDGKSTWLYLVKNKEVQINNFEKESTPGGISSPQDLFKAYAWNQYIYVLSGEFTENGKLVQQIEFKPTDKKSEYTKIRLTLDKKTTNVISIKTFSKDGSRYTLNVTKLSPNVSVAASVFQFSKNECPSCHFEDLRI